MNQRTESYRKAHTLEHLLAELKTLLEPVEYEAIRPYTKTRFPVVFIVGCARSGSTLLLQWLAKTRVFAYPTNLISRFFYAPYIGARIQQMLTDPEYQFKEEFAGIQKEFGFDSDIGKTKGILAPNEFWYFWRRFFPFGEIQTLDDTSLKRVDTGHFVSEIAALEAAFGKVVAMKGMIMNWHLDYLDSLFEKCLFLYTNRNIIYNVQSLLRTREKFFGTRERWYSFKPPEYPMLKGLDPVEQVTGQVYFTNKAIEEHLTRIDENRWIRVNYESFCRNPGRVFEEIFQRLTSQGYALDCPAYAGPDMFQHTNRLALSRDEVDLIRRSYRRFSGKDLKR